MIMLNTNRMHIPMNTGRRPRKLRGKLQHKLNQGYAAGDKKLFILFFRVPDHSIGLLEKYALTDKNKFRRVSHRFCNGITKSMKDPPVTILRSNSIYFITVTRR